MAAYETQYAQEKLAKFHSKNDPTPTSAKKGMPVSKYQLKKGTPIKLKGYIKLMHALGFISLKNNSANEEELITDLWKFIGGTNTNTVKAENLMLVLAAVMNL